MHGSQSRLNAELVEQAELLRKEVNEERVQQGLQPLEDCPTLLCVKGLRQPYVLFLVCFLKFALQHRPTGGALLGLFCRFYVSFFPS